MARRIDGQEESAAAAAPRLSRRVDDLHASPVREILAVIDRPGMVSFAGGLPAPESFPRLDLEGLPPGWLQYGPSEGEPELRAAIAQELRALGLRCEAEQVLVLSGSQQGIDLAAKLFIDPGTPLWVETPTYLAALQVFRFFGARLVDELAAQGPQRPALAYVIPTFQNPTGRCMDAAARGEFARACDAAGIAVFEDDPYRDLVYDPCERTPVCARLRRSSWIYQGSFSKTFAPALRLGFLAASADLIVPLTRLKQAADLHSSRVSQWLVLQHLRDPGRARRLEQVIAIYRERRDAFARLLQASLGAHAHWELPSGGLFFWLELERCLDTRSLLPAAIERGVAFMPGEPFYPDAGPARGRLRLNFSHAAPEQAARGLRILGELLRAA
jgi:DNA-binding transcriptional MocR family regulator